MQGVAAAAEEVRNLATRSAQAVRRMGAAERNPSFLLVGFTHPTCYFFNNLIVEMNARS